MDPNVTSVRCTNKENVGLVAVVNVNVWFTSKSSIVFDKPKEQRIKAWMCQVQHGNGVVNQYRNLNEFPQI